MTFNIDLSTSKQHSKLKLSNDLSFFSYEPGWGRQIDRERNKHTAVFNKLTGHSTITTAILST